MSPGPAAARANARWTKPGTEGPAGGVAPGALIASCDLRAPSALRRSPSPDAQLVELMQERNVHAFELIYLRHAAAVFGLARRIVREQSVAEDVTHDVFISVWRSCDCYQPGRGSVRNWVLGLTRHRATEEARRRSVRRAVEALPLSHAEIAEALDVPLGTLKGRLQLGLNKLRQELGPREDELAR